MPNLSAAQVAQAESRAELAYSQGLWYAWGRIDSGAYGEDAARLPVFEFANRVKQDRLDFELEKTHKSESIQGQWDKFVADKIGTRAVDADWCENPDTCTDPNH